MTTDEPPEPDAEPPEFEPEPDLHDEAVASDDGPAPEPVAEFSRKWAIGALAANIGVLLFCSPVFGLVGIVIAGIGLSRVGSRPDSARTFVRWAWIVFGLALFLSIALNIWFLSTAEDEASTLTALGAIGTVDEH